MARKRSSPPPPEIPADDSEHVDAASDDEEQSIESDSKNDVAEEENGDEESEEEDAESVNPKDESIEQQQQLSSQGSESIGKESGSDPGSGSGSESSPVEPIRSKPMKVLSKTGDPKPKRKRATVKRDAKRARVVSSANGGDEKRSGINRLWSEDDEIVILQGLIDYNLANDDDPFSNLEAFYESVKDSLHVSVSIKQLSDKIRRLKKKFFVNADKGDDFVFVKPHEDKSFDLSKKIWGNGGGGDDVSKVKGSRKKKKNNNNNKFAKGVNNVVNGKDDVDELENCVEDDDEGLDFKAMYPNLSKAWDSDFGCSQPLKEISMGNFQSIASEKIRGMEKEWKDMYVKEMQLYVNKLDLKMKHAKVVLDQMISSDL